MLEIRSPPDMPVQKVPYKLDLGLLGVVEGLSFIDSDSTDSQSRSSRTDPKILCHYFGGIPYALPPVGPYRFKRPRALPVCYRYGTHANPGRFVGGCGVCPQPKPDAGPWEEDCLQLNVWVPAEEPPEKGRSDLHIIFHVLVLVIVFYISRILVSISLSYFFQLLCGASKRG